MKDFICIECPLADCDETSLWCAFRWATQLNEAQQAIVGVKMMPKQKVPRKRRKRVARRAYMAAYYQEHKAQKLAAANERNRAIREMAEG